MNEHIGTDILLEAGVISEEDAKRIGEVVQKRRERYMHLMIESNGRAAEKYRQLPRWRRWFQSESNFIMRNRDYWPIR